MATLAQINPEAQRYPKQSFDWRRTHIHIGEGAAESAPYGRDAVMDDFSNRKEMHRVLDKACSKGNVTADRAAQLHARLDKLLDDEPDFFSKLGGEEIELDDLPDESEAKRTNQQETGQDSDRPEAAKDSGRMSYALDSGKCSACRIQENHVPAKKTAALDAAHRTMADTVIAFWRQFGINLQQVKL